MKKKNKIFEKIKILYILVFALGTIIIAPTHIFPSPTFMYARFPHYLELMEPFFGFSWPATFEIYHYILYVLAIIVTVNASGVLFYPRFKNVTIFSLIIGAFLFSLIILFFFFRFININAPTAIAYGFYSVSLLTVDLLTLKAFVKQKAA